MFRRYGALVGGLCGLAMVCTAYAAEMTVSQKDKTFSSEDLKQTVGSTLRISNDDTVAHNVQMTTPSGETRNFGVQKPGESVEAPLEKAGDYAVRCGIHPRMKLSVHVQ